MATTNDEQLRSLKSLLSVTIGDLGTLTSTALATVITNDTDDLNDQWKVFLLEQGYQNKDINTAMYDYLGVKGYTGTLEDRLNAAWAADDVLSNLNNLLINESGEYITTDAGEFMVVG